MPDTIIINNGIDTHFYIVDYFLAKDLPCPLEDHAVSDLSSDYNPGLATIILVALTCMPTKKSSEQSGLDWDGSAQTNKSSSP